MHRHHSTNAPRDRHRKPNIPPIVTIAGAIFLAQFIIVTFVARHFEPPHLLITAASKASTIKQALAINNQLFAQTDE